MLEDFHKDLSKNSKKLIEKGYFIADIEDIDLLNRIRSSFVSYLKDSSGIEILPQNLEALHKKISVDNVNDIRFGFYQFINNSHEDFTLDYLKLAMDFVTEVTGSELASNKNVNFSIQMPDDSSSVLPLHSDIFSGESPYQINLWVPLTDAKDTNSMFIFNPEFSHSVCKNFSQYEEHGLEELMNENKDDLTFLDIPYGKFLIFSPTCLHGNVINKTDKTRLSFNCRYKNIFSPYNKAKESDKKLGSFYKPLTPKAASLIGMNFEIDEK